MAELLGPGRRFQPAGARAEITAARALTVLATLGIIAALYFAKVLLVPLALAILLTFVLAPLVRLLRAWGVGRIPAVAIVVVLAFVVIFGVGSFIGEQLAQLAGKLPQYQYVIQRKIQSLSTATSGGTLERLSSFLEHLNKEMGKKETGPAQTPASSEGGAATAPIPVEIHSPPPTPIELFQRVFTPLLDPLATTGVVVVFVIFFLLERRDLRDRLIRLAGSHDLHGTTEAFNDAAGRLSRYFLAQTALNALFGLIVATGLGLIGVPNPVLWGIMGMVLRFIPYIGAIIAAAGPVALALAVDPGWSTALWTVGLFIVVEPIIGQVVEPLVYGHSTGLSPVAVIVAATFWTWLWGPIGLLLSTPLTVCLGVLGRHIEWLQFLDILIGNEAPLSPAQSFYQRALAGDADELGDQAEQLLTRLSLSAYYDDVVLQALIFAEIDARRGVLEERQIGKINSAVRGLIEDLSAFDDQTPRAAGKPESERAVSLGGGDEVSQKPDLPVLEPNDFAPEWRGEQPLVCLPGRGPFDETTAAMLAQLLEKHGFRVRFESNAALASANIVRLNSAGVMMVCLCLLDIGHSPAQLRYAARRVRRQVPQAAILAGLWGHDQTIGATSEANAGEQGIDFYACSLRQAMSIAIDTARAAATAAGGTPGSTAA